jgi:hypothetical protein
LGYYRVYKTALVFSNTDGFIVDPTATLTLGKIYDGTGDPFIIVFANGTTSGASSKAVICDGGKVNLESNMAIYGTPVNGAGIYANGGRVISDKLVASKNGIAVYAENSSVKLKSPTIAQNTAGVVAAQNGVIEIVSSGASFDYTIFANNRIAGVVSGTTLDITDPNLRLLVGDKQQGIVSCNNGLISIVPSTTGSYTSVISGVGSTSGSTTTTPQPIILGMVGSNYRVVSSSLNGILSVNGGTGTISFVSGTGVTFTSNPIAYYNQASGV